MPKPLSRTAWSGASSKTRLDTKLDGVYGQKAPFRSLLAFEGSAMKATHARTSTAKQAPSLTATTLKSNLKSSASRELLEQRFTISPIMAKHILDKHNKRNRTLNEHHMSSIARDIKNGNWIDGTGSMISFAKDGSLMDGQHRLAAIVSAKRPLKLSVKFGLEKEAQRVIDTGRKRTYSDFIAMSEGMDSPYKAERASVTRMLFGFLNDPHTPCQYAKHHKPTQSDLIDVAKEFREDIAKAVSLVCAPGLVTKITVGSHAAFAAVLMRHSEYSEYIEEFFDLLGTGANLDADDPIMVIRNRFMIRPDLRTATMKDASIGLLLKGWNHWINGDAVSNKMHSPDKLVQVVGLSKMGTHDVYD